MPRVAKPPVLLKATLYVPFDNQPPREVQIPRTGTFDPIYKLLDCDMVEVVRLDKRRVMLIDEDGKVKGLPVNEMASVLARGFIQSSDYIAGKAIVGPSSMLSKGR